MLHGQCLRNGLGVGGKAVKITGVQRSGMGPRGPNIFYMFLSLSVASPFVDCKKVTLPDQAQFTLELKVSLVDLQ